MFLLLLLLPALVQGLVLPSPSLTGYTLEEVQRARPNTYCSLAAPGCPPPSSPCSSPATCCTDPAGCCSPCCHDVTLFKDKDNLLAIQTEEDYLCAFVAFQVHTKKVYPDEEVANGRYLNFKTCVDDVNQNNRKEDRSYTAGVNHFCDMTHEERLRQLGLVVPSNLSSLPSNPTLVPQEIPGDETDKEITDEEITVEEITVEDITDGEVEPQGEDISGEDTTER